jgi:hypothetical protein
MMSDLIVERSDGATLMAHDEREHAAILSLNPIPRDRAWVMLYLLREWGFSPRLNEGKRSAERQAQLFAEGKSTVRHSKHQDGDAWDICDLDHGWDTTKEFKRAVGRAARIVGAVWGGQWRSFGPEGDWAHSEFQGGKIVG